MKGRAMVGWPMPDLHHSNETAVAGHDTFNAGTSSIF